MNIVQRIRASHLNRHGFVDVTVGLIVFQVIYSTLMLLFCNVDYGVDETDSMSLGKIIFISLLIAPYFENLLLIGVAAIFEKLFNRKVMFLFAPSLLTALHFITPKEFPLPVLFRILTLYTYFYIFLKQYDLHKLELGKHKSLLLSSVIHAAINASTLIVATIFEPDIAAETIFQHNQESEMRSLNMNELKEVQGGGIGTTWAIRAISALSDLVTLVELGLKVEFDPSSYGPVDAGGYNPMGDYTNGICLR